jgi:hypothetical protein
MILDPGPKIVKVPLALQLGIILSLVLIALLIGACQAVDTTPTDTQPLQANAGQDIQVKVGEAPSFDGCSSTGPVANYRWTIVEAPEGMLEYDGKIIREIDPGCAFTLEASMLAEEVGLWEIELEVRDESGDTSTDRVNVEVVP